MEQGKNKQESAEFIRVQSGTTELQPWVANSNDDDNTESPRL
jgi:hypothetical protein